MNDEEAEELFNRVRGINSRHDKRYMKNVDKARYGTKTHQIGFRLSVEEIDVWRRVQAHWDGPFSGWVTYVMLRFAEYQQQETFPALSDRVTAACRWVPPSPTPYCKHCQVTTFTRDSFMQHFPGLPVSRMVRWAMLDEAPRALAAPTRSEQLAAALSFQQQILDEPLPVAHATPLIGHTLKGNE